MRKEYESLYSLALYFTVFFSILFRLPFYSVVDDFLPFYVLLVCQFFEERLVKTTVLLG